MTNTSPNDWSTGPIAPVETKTIGPIEVDCTGWEADIPAERWSSGRLERAGVPPISD